MPFTRNLKSILVRFGLVAAVGAAPVALMAGDVSSGGGPLIEAQAAEQFDDATIEAFAAAQARVEEVRSEYAAQYQAAQTEEQRLEINQTATVEMTEAVRDTPDITIEEYSAIIDAANRDPAFAERVNEAISETQL
ncbi:DUF4168 domain-containing protein [Rhodovulum steppense]|uniref:Uncharacterized protein DUF4168 n=1 Tax=Rhodovulum steppense TaxID=540251 RepID=A0A4R1YSV5_9RHOB|nr:DUF4168 domain-containing protein [Rhodovulum steppense]TCM82726.1 uncharacterized protein DUF4168 [Rhodovulum steppense]